MIEGYYGSGQTSSFAWKGQLIELDQLSSSDWIEIDQHILSEADGCSKFHPTVELYPIGSTQIAIYM